jgi:hypothetical protein
VTTALLCGRGAALGLTVQPLVMALLDGSPALPASAMPDANTLFNMAERLSGSFGIALLATLYASRAAATGSPGRRTARLRPRAHRGRGCGSGGRRV